jgi:flavin reductase (DIM6/NTAB) family NADH-FMN oxidoreductase RutF
MSHFTTGVTVVTAQFDNQDWGMTCNSFSTVSLAPPLVLWSIRKESLSHPAFTQSGGYTVSILASTQQHLAMQFSQGTQAERFLNVPVTRSEIGQNFQLGPRINGAVAWFDCALESTVSAGDHDILIGRVLAFGSQEGDGLIYSQRHFGRFKPL